ncbi:MAG: MBL fold metallo-hydrolase RNA specificity domain-containing protein [Candidatus ainarchaeum sp.]|nr:MBL fold metallo-hydrolase RNA specificity domain-containing protein [Candidatus ainarchaeum sp.]
MKLKCLGAGQEVGRSGILIKTDNENILFDYGLKLHPKFKNQKNKNLSEKYKIEEEYTEEPLKIKEHLDAVILSHAHLDHSGDIPSLYKKGDPNLFLTEATLELSNLLWLDTLKIAKYDDKEPPFNKDEIKFANKAAFYLNLRETIEISKYSRLTFYDAGHISGSVISILETEGKKIMYTGDIRSEKSTLFKGFDRNLPQVDILITESTYGNKNHKSRENLEKELISEIKETIENGHKVILAAFAIERTQELIALLDKYKINAPIYVDGMGIKASRIFADHKEYLNDLKSFKKALDRTELITNHRTRKDILRTPEPAIIITTAGMLEGGPVMLYLKEFGNNKDNKLILTGYQVDGTNGDRLLKTGKLYIDKELYKINCQIKHVSISAHLDQKELFELIDIVKPKKIICVHGDSKTIEEFRKEINKKKIENIAPKVGDIFDI